MTTQERKAHNDLAKRDNGRYAYNKPYAKPLPWWKRLLGLR